MRWTLLALAAVFLLGTVSVIQGQQPTPTAVLKIWPGKPPGPEMKVGPEKDLAKPGDKIIKLTNVTAPEIHVYLPPKEKRNGTAVVVCPGGGFNILAWDLEGTEVAHWLNKLGVSAVVLKYRTPTASQKPAWLEPVQDAERALSLTRSKAAEWGLASNRIGILGFSAGGHTAARVALKPDERAYDAVDDVDKLPFRPNFAVLVYPGGLIDTKTGLLPVDVTVAKDTPPMFLVHAANDPVTCNNSVQIFLALKKAGIPGELHIYDAGGHGYGLRFQKDLPVTTWPQRCADWLNRGGWLKG